MNGNEMSGPLPIPELTLATPAPDVTDEDRNRYGVLLDHAAERGLLSPSAYRFRLAELGEATSMEQLRRIVTELPAFERGAPRAAVPTASSGPTAAPVGSPSRSPGPATHPGTPTPEFDAALWSSLTPASSRHGQGNRWIILVVVVVILMVAMVGLALVAAHAVHVHSGHSTGMGAAGLSLLRL